MAICKVCGREMRSACGCISGMIMANGKKYKRIKMGDPDDFYPFAAKGERCGDCNAATGHYHHWGCDCERCPACGGQLISCDCEDVSLSCRKQAD